MKRLFGCFAACVLPLLACGQSLPLSTAAPAATRARVVIVSDESATQAFKAVPAVTRALVHRGITNFTGQSDISAAWGTLVSTQDVVGIKIFSAPGLHIGTRLPVVEGVIEGLLAAKVRRDHIIVWDRRLADVRRAGFSVLADRYGIRLAGSVDSGWDENAFYESSILGQLVFGDFEFQKKGESVGRKSFLTRLVTRQITKIISVSPLLNHNSAGVCGNLYSVALGSVDNTIRFEGDPAKLALAVPEIYALPTLGERVVLNIVDALVCQYQGEQIGRLHYSAELNQLRFSTDPVALDVLSIDELDAQRKRTFPDVRWSTNRLELYRNAALLELGIADRKQIDVQFHP